MKKTLILVLSLTLLLVAFAGTFSVSAATQYTKENIVAKLSESPIYKYVKGDVTNLTRTVDATPEQLNKLYDIADRFVKLGIKDKGGSAHDYTKAEIKSILALLDEACDVLGYSYTFTTSAKAQHKGDVVLSVFDAAGKQVYKFDGDVVKQTGFDATATFVTVSTLGVALLAAAALVAKKARV